MKRAIDAWSFLELKALYELSQTANSDVEAAKEFIITRKNRSLAATKTKLSQIKTGKIKLDEGPKLKKPPTLVKTNTPSYMQTPLPQFKVDRFRAKEVSETIKYYDVTFVVGNGITITASEALVTRQIPQN